MTYDFSSALNAAKNVVNNAQSQDAKSYPYPLVYPQKGQVVTVKLLFNPASNQVLRLVNRHDKVPCYKSYNTECPICKTMQQVIDATGQDPFGKSKSKARGIAFAQYISSSIPIESNGRKLNPGETILFMYPWSVYTQLSAMIQAIGQTPSGMEKAFCSSDGGLFVQVTVDSDFKYTVVQVPFMTFTSGITDDQYRDMLDKMPSLYEQVIPDKITQEVDAQVKEYVDGIYKQYISPRVPSATPSTPINAGAVPQTTIGQQDEIPVAQNGKPQCMGHHQAGLPQCICCPDEVLCLQASAQIGQ